MFILLLATPLISAPYCPNDCKCNISTSTAKCSGLGTVPTNFGFEVKKLILDQFKSETIPPDTFLKCKNCSKIDFLSLRQGSLKRLENGSLRGLDSLTQVFFTHNKLISVDMGALEGAFMPAAELVIDFTQNLLTELPPLQLPCKMGFDKTISLLFQSNNIHSAAVPTIWTNSCSTTLRLKELGLSSNPIGSINAADFLPLKYVSTLSKLNLAKTQLANISPDAFTHLPFLQSLDLSDNPLNELQLYNVFLGTPSVLKSLTVRDLQLNGPPAGSNKSIINSTFFAYLSRAANLEKLELSHNKLVFLDDADTFTSLHSMKYLFLENCSLQRMHRDILRDNSQLIRLRLSNNSLSRAPVAYAAGLQELTLNHNQLAGPFRVDLLTGVPVSEKFTTLDLSYNRFNGLEEGSFAGEKLPGLAVLNLSHNAIAKLDGDPLVFEPLRATLQSLDLSFQSPPLRTLASNLFASLQHLRDLSLSNNNLTQLPNHIFGGLAALDKLFLQNNHISTWDAELFAGSNNLTILDMTNNSIETLSPAQFLQLPKSLKEWRLAGNPWRCDCELLAFREWLPTTRVKVSGWHDFRCADLESRHSNRTFSSFSNQTLDCPELRPVAIPWFFFLLCLFLLAVACASCAFYFIYVWPVRRTIRDLRKFRGEHARMPVSNRLRLQVPSAGESRLNLLNENAVDEQEQQQEQRVPPVRVFIAGSSRVPRALIFYTQLDCPRELLDSIAAILGDPSIGCIVDGDVVTEIHHQPNISHVALMNVIGRRDLVVFVYSGASAGDALFKRCISVAYKLSLELSGFPPPILVRAPLSPRPRAFSFPQRFFAEWEDGAIQVPSRDPDAVSIAESVHEGHPQVDKQSGDSGAQLSSEWKEHLRVCALERLRFTSDAHDVPAPEAV